MDFSLEQTVEEFLYEKAVQGYESALRSFEKYLLSKKIYCETLKTYLQGIRSDTLVDSLSYFIEVNNITSLSRCNTYISCIKEYFIYIITKGYIKNDELMAEFAYKTYSEKSYRYKMNCFISTQKSITSSEGFEIFDDGQVIDLIKECDLTMSDDYILSRVETHKTYFNKYSSALSIKLILLTGIKYSTLAKIKIDDLSLQYCSITINDLTIHLPNNIIDQFRKYIEIRSKVLENAKIDSPYLFIKYGSYQISQQTSTIAAFLEGLTGRRDLNGIIKYAITNMIKKGINQSIIIKFTGIGGGSNKEKQSIYDYCQYRVNKIMDISSSRYLDSKIRSLEIFDEL